jgi:hypothetical protein
MGGKLPQPNGVAERKSNSLPLRFASPALQTQEVIAKTKKLQNGGFCRSFFSPTGC